MSPVTESAGSVEASAADAPVEWPAVSGSETSAAIQEEPPPPVSPAIELGTPIEEAPAEGWRVGCGTSSNGECARFRCGL